MPNPYPIVQVNFCVSMSNEEGPKNRVHEEGPEVALVEKLVTAAIELGGVWDEHKETFYPWHSIARVVHHRYGMTLEEAEKHQQDTELAMQLAESRIVQFDPEYDPFSSL